MAIYYVFLFSVFIYAIFELRGYYYEVTYIGLNFVIGRNKVARCRKIIIILFFIQLNLIAAFRNERLCPDLINYGIAFRSLLDSNFSDLFTFTRIVNADIGYYLLNWVVGKFTDSFQIFMIIAGIIPIFLFLHFFYKESKSIWLSLFIFLGLGALSDLFSMLRQIISIGIIMYSFHYIKEQNLKKYLLCIILAISFHKTAVFCIPMYVFAYHKLDFFNIIKYFLIFFGVIFCGNFMLDFLISNYKEGIYTETRISGTGYVWLSFLLIIAITGLIFKDYAIFSKKSNVIVYNMIILSVILQLFSLHFSAFVRIVYYYSYFLTIFIPNIIYSIKDKYLRASGICVTTISFFMLFTNRVVNDTSGVVPYSFFWDS